MFLYTKKKITVLLICPLRPGGGGLKAYKYFLDCFPNYLPAGSIHSNLQWSEKKIPFPLTEANKNIGLFLFCNVKHS